MQGYSAQNRGYIIKMMNKLHALILMLILGATASTMHNGTDQTQVPRIQLLLQNVPPLNESLHRKLQDLIIRYSHTDPKKTDIRDSICDKIEELISRPRLLPRNLLSAFNEAASTELNVPVNGPVVIDTDLMCNEGPEAFPLPNPNIN